jgi:hypothetical protein
MQFREAPSITGENLAVDTLQSRWWATIPSPTGARCRYGRTFKTPAASNMALAAFQKWDDLTHDSWNKGWNGASSTGKTEPPKSLDAAVHILEALVELWQTFPNNTFVRCVLNPCMAVSEPLHASAV